jgi:hypothetical protein
VCHSVSRIWLVVLYLTMCASYLLLLLSTWMLQSIYFPACNETLTFLGEAEVRHASCGSAWQSCYMLGPDCPGPICASLLLCSCYVEWCLSPYTLCSRNSPAWLTSCKTCCWTQIPKDDIAAGHKDDDEDDDGDAEMQQALQESAAGASGSKK